MKDAIDTPLLACVSDTGPLISLEKLTDGFSLMRNLVRTIIVPPSVMAEVAADQFPSPGAYLLHYGVADFIRVQAPINRELTIHVHHELHPAEIDAINLAIELSLPLLIEEAIGRRAAMEIGLTFSGIAGQVLRAVRTDVITKTSGREQLTRLLRHGRISRILYQQLIEELTTMRPD